LSVLLEGSVKESIVNCLSVFQQNDPKKSAFFYDPSPNPYPPIGLDFGLMWELDYTPYPIIL